MTGEHPGEQPPRDTDEEVEGHGFSLPDNAKVSRDEAPAAPDGAAVTRKGRPMAPKMRH